jgi:hypothetical protein
MIYLGIPSIPPTVNQAYRSQPRRVGEGKKAKTIITRVLSEEGKRYKTETKTHLAREHPLQLREFKPDVPYTLVIEFTFHGRDSLYCKSWGEKNGAESRYKVLDVGNRLKLLEDALASATGIDDKHNFAILLSKTWARDYEATDIWVWNREEEPDNPINELLLHLRKAQSHRAVPSLSSGWSQGSS